MKPRKRKPPKTYRLKSIAGWVIETRTSQWGKTFKQTVYMFPTAQSAKDFAENILPHIQASL